MIYSRNIFIKAISLIISSSFILTSYEMIEELLDFLFTQVNRSKIINKFVLYRTYNFNVMLNDKKKYE